MPNSGPGPVQRGQHYFILTGIQDQLMNMEGLKIIQGIYIAYMYSMGIRQKVAKEFGSSPDKEGKLEKQDVCIIVLNEFFPHCHSLKLQEQVAFRFAPHCHGVNFPSNTTSGQLEPIFSLVALWHKLEFESWPALLNEVQSQCERKAGKLWFPLYSIFQQNRSCDVGQHEVSMIER